MNDVLVTEVSNASIAPRTRFPLAVDLDGTLLKVDTLYETFAAGLFAAPVRTILALAELRHGIAAFKRKLSGIAQLDVDTLPVREELLAYISGEAARRVARSIWRRRPIRPLRPASPPGFRCSGR